MYSLGEKLLVVCAGPGEVSNLGCERRHCSLYHLLVSFGILWKTNLGIFAKGNLLLSTSNLPLGVTNKESCHSVSSKFLAPLPGTPVYKIGELHTIFYLCILVLLVYLSVFTFVSLIKNTCYFVSSYHYGWSFCLW